MWHMDLKTTAYKFSLGGNASDLNQETNTWVNVYYINDIHEIGSFEY